MANGFKVRAGTRPSPAEQLQWTGGQILGWTPPAAEVSAMVAQARAAGIPPELAWTRELPHWKSSDGREVIQLPSGKAVLFDHIINYLAAHPEHTFLASQSDALSKMDYAVNLQISSGEARTRSINDPTMPWGRVGAGAPPTTYGRAGMPTTRYGAPAEWYPPVRWGRPIEEVTEYARPEYEPAYYERLEAAKPTVSPARYEWMAGLRPELLRQWQAGRPVSEAEFAREPYKVEYEVAPITSEDIATRVRELSKTMTLEAAEEMAGAWAKGQLQRRALTAEEQARTGALGLARTAAEQRQAKWGAWVGEYPFKEEWYRMAPRERGIYPGRYAPPTRWRV